MRKERSLFILGILIIILPQLGLPPLWKQVTSILMGVAIIYLAYLYYYQNKIKVKKEEVLESFVDSPKIKI